MTFLLLDLLVFCVPFFFLIGGIFHHPLFLFVLYSLTSLIIFFSCFSYLKYSVDFPFLCLGTDSKSLGQACGINFNLRRPRQADFLWVQGQPGHLKWRNFKTARLHKGDFVPKHKNKRRGVWVYFCHVLFFHVCNKSYYLIWKWSV